MLDATQCAGFPIPEGNRGALFATCKSVINDLAKGGISNSPLRPSIAVSVGFLPDCSNPGNHKAQFSPIARGYPDRSQLAVIDAFAADRAAMVFHRGCEARRAS